MSLMDWYRFYLAEHRSKPREPYLTEPPGEKIWDKIDREFRNHLNWGVW